MIHILTILVMIIIAWSIYSIAIVMDDGELMIYSQDDIILKIAKIYWWIILIGLGLLALWIFSYMITSTIYCSTNNNDDKICETIN